ncbi:hypothetical protein SELMODRAFT_404625 [Selaginella moellendorffii]|uniref:Uncharacterized protein n=1 Tax=Selaginella moellendorffii TaxID=88036 RepID=D8QVX0_SELML|nr:hypothetical protein SELMODRAFT_404625 [Selaginella moellendorffii]
MAAIYLKDSSLLRGSDRALRRCGRDRMGILLEVLALMTKALSDEHKDRAYQVVFSEVASGMLLGCGAVYVVGVLPRFSCINWQGLLCIKKFKRSRIEKSKEREKAAKDLEELEKRRGELQALLSARG